MSVPMSVSTHSGTRRLLLRLMAAAVAVTGLAGCGVALDDSPRTLGTAERPDLDSQTEQPAAAGGASSPKVFFLTGQGSLGPERLQGVSRDVNPQPKIVLGELLKGLTPVERDRRLQTFVPAQTQLIETNLLPDGTLEVDLDEAFFDAKGESQTKAVAQIVYTATGLRQVKRVRLLVDGQPRDWPRGDGVVVSTPLTPFDFPDLNPSSQPDLPPALSPSTAGPSGS